MTESHSAFSTLRSYLWPIHRHELKKIVPMFIMLFFVCFNYTILRNLKDSLVVPDAGAEVLPYIKVWVVLPCAILATIAFTFLSNHFSRRKLFYIIISSFISYFLLFTFVIYPCREALFAHTVADYMQGTMPHGFKGLIAMIRMWPLTMFYVIGELWSTMVMTVLFWGFANEVTKMSEATRFYSALNIGSNSASIMAGQIAVFLSSSMSSSFLFGTTAWEQALTKQLLLVIVCSVGILAAFHWMTKHVLHDPKYMPKEALKTKKDKKLNFRQSLQYVAKSKYLLCIAAIVVSYNLVIHMVEVIWKDRLRELFPGSVDYNIYTNNLTSLMGFISMMAALVMFSIIRKLGWTKTAIITPMVLLITTSAFFGCLLLNDALLPVIALFGTTPLALAVFLGSAQNCFSKAAKYSLFDTTKEMSFIPLAPEHKLKGKAAIDGIGSRLGKSGGSIIHQGLLFFCCTLGASTPYVAGILLAVIVVWIVAVRSLGKQFTEKTKGIDLAELKDDMIEPETVTAEEKHAPLQVPA
jgi:ATP:ADP antiporter, AAA family